MAKIKVDNILKIVDVEVNQLHPDTKKFFETIADPTYKDQKLKEDIYNVEDIQIKYSEEENQTPEVSGQLEELAKLAYKNKAGYIRIIYY